MRTSTGNYEFSGYDLDGLEEIPTTMLFIPEADTTVIIEFLDLFFTYQNYHLDPKGIFD